MIVTKYENYQWKSSVVQYDNANFAYNVAYMFPTTGKLLYKLHNLKTNKIIDIRKCKLPLKIRTIISNPKGWLRIWIY